MDRKTKGVLVLFALLMSCAQVGKGAAASPPIELGYGPTALFPVQTGTPVYAIGDQMWARSGFNATVHFDLVPAQTAASPPTAEVALAPGIPTLLHVFSSDDPQGLWLLSSPDAGAGFSPVLFEVSAATVNSSLMVSSHGLSGGTLAVNFSVSGGLQFYDGEACMVGGSPGAPSVAVPESAGGGELELYRNMGDLVATGTDLGNQSVDFWVELSYSYSFLAPNSTSTLLSTEVVASSTGVGELSRDQPSTLLGLQDEGTPRAGLYTLRAFFKGTTGVSEAQTQVLVLSDGEWISLTGCAPKQVESDSFVLSTALGTDPALWPDAVYFTYKTHGVEGYMTARLGLNVSALSFVGEPWGAPLGGYRIVAGPVGGTNSTAAGGGTVFVEMDRGPSVVDYALGLGGKTYFAGTFGPVSPGSAYQVGLNTSRVMVQFLVGGKPFPGGNVTVLQGGASLESGTTDSAGEAQFILPAGNFTLEASGGNSTASQEVTLELNQSISIQLGAGPSQGVDPALVFELAAVGAAAVVVNLVVFAERRRLRSRSEKSQGAGAKPSQ